MKGECLAGLSAKSWLSDLPTYITGSGALQICQPNGFEVLPLRPLVCDGSYTSFPALAAIGMLRHLLQKSAFAALLGMAAT